RLGRRTVSTCVAVARPRRRGGGSGSRPAQRRDRDDRAAGSDRRRRRPPRRARHQRPRGVIDRLRSSGVVTVVEDEVRGTLLKVPTLLAAKLRRDLDSAAGAGPVVASLLDVLVEHMESTGILEAE